jgi:hypothetical protein
VRVWLQQPLSRQQLDRLILHHGQRFIAKRLARLPDRVRGYRFWYARYANKYVW